MFRYMKTEKIIKDKSMKTDKQEDNKLRSKMNLESLTKSNTEVHKIQLTETEDNKIHHIEIMIDSKKEGGNKDKEDLIDKIIIKKRVNMVRETSIEIKTLNKTKEEMRMNDMKGDQTLEMTLNNKIQE